MGQNGPPSEGDHGAVSRWEYQETGEKKCFKIPIRPIRHALCYDGDRATGRRGRETSSPPQFGHVEAISRVQRLQNVHS